MLRLKYIEMRNFLSFGNVAQRVNLQDSPLTIILGMNNDVTTNGTEEETRNGVGKSSVIQALNFVIYGKSVDNKIKVGNLINKTNKKHCEVKLVFEKNGIDYTIIRKRGPTDLIFLVGDTNYNDTVNDEAQGDNRDSQYAITEVIGMSQDLFQQIVTITTSVDSFLGLPGLKQRQLIEELLTITQLSEKADKLKELLKQVKEAISREQFRVETIEASNKKIMLSITALENQSVIWNQTRDATLLKNTQTIDALSTVDIEFEKTQQEAKQVAIDFNKKVQDQLMQFNQITQRASVWDKSQLSKIDDVNDAIQQLSSINITDELTNHQNNDTWNQLQVIHKNNVALADRIKKDISATTSRHKKHKIEFDRLTSQLSSTHGEKCHVCDSVIDSHKHSEITTQLKKRIDEVSQHVTDSANEIQAYTTQHENIEMFEMPDKSVTVYSNINDAYKHQSNLESLHKELISLQNEINPFNAQLNEFVLLVPVGVPVTHYDSISQVYQHISVIDMLTSENASLNAQCNPYDNQINTLKNDSMQNIDYSELNRQRKMQEHQEFLIKLLTDKNSYVRKRIIDQNLGFLNQRLETYMIKTGSSHHVNFMNDLTVNITQMGEDYDFDNLSRGEKNRVIIALSIAFRDMFESLNFGINTLMLDEYLDQGLDSAGTNACYKILKELSEQNNKNVFLVTHREELQAKCENIMLVVKENGFTTIEQNDFE